jgi:23S rRNA (uracil1939-C5)-methyltransferase
MRLCSLAEELSAPAPRAVSGSQSGYRHRARLMVRGRARSPKIGLFQEASHRIADTPRCPIHHPLINSVAGVVREGMRRRAIEPYADAPHRGALRAIQVVVERSSQSAQVVLVENAARPERVAALEEDLAAALGSALHSVFWNGNPGRTNTLLGPHWQHLHGPDAVVETLGGARVHFPPAAFGQSNLPLVDSMLEQIAAWVPADAHVAEYYAGCGAIGLGLLARGAHLTFNERSEGSLAGLTLGLSALDEESRARARVLPGDTFNERSEGSLAGLTLGLSALDEESRARARVLPGDAGDLGDSLEDAPVVIVDPPRRGIDARLLEALCATPPRLLVSVSCGLDAFEREARALVSTGRVALRELVAFDLFPHTHHVETLARFERRSPHEEVPAA